jgi:hypothetical protein
MISEFLAAFGIAIENRTQLRPDIAKVESAVAIGRLFDRDCERQDIEHKLALRGGPLISTNATSLGRVKCEADGWLR